MGFLQAQLEEKLDLLKKDKPALPIQVDIDVQNVLGAIGTYLSGAKYDPDYATFLNCDRLYRVDEDEVPYVQRVCYLGYACAFVAAGEALGHCHEMYYQLQHQAQYWLSL